MILPMLLSFLSYSLYRANAASLPKECLLPHSQGESTSQAFFMYTFDSQMFECIGFIYSGSGGNANRFWSKRDCEDKCVIPSKK